MLKMGKFFSIGPFIISLWACSVADPISIPRPETQNDVARQETSLSYPAFSDIDAHEGVGSTPKRYPVHGIDVSRWQGEIDWRSARAAGIAFAYLKATEGGDTFDPMFQSHWDGAKNAGVRHGAYHYFYFCRSAEE